MDAAAIAAIAMQHDQERMRSISQNLANVGTVGYKREIPLGQRFAQVLSEAAPAAPVRDFGAGTLRATGSELDLAIDGPGFFEVQTEQGIAYTRRGNFRPDGQGRLALPGGGAVLQTGGGPVFLTSAPVSIDAQGRMMQEGRQVGQITVVRFSDPQRLTALGEGLYRADSAGIDRNLAPGSVRSGYLENANVNSAQEMVRMNETLRHFESLQRSLQGYDDMFDKAVRKLGEF